MQRAVAPTNATALDLRLLLASATLPRTVALIAPLLVAGMLLAVRLPHPLPRVPRAETRAAFAAARLALGTDVGQVPSRMPPSDPGAEEPTLILLPVLLAALVFWPTPAQFFYREDLYHLYRAVNQPWPALLLQQHAGHLYSAFSALVVACHALFGMRADGWFAVLLALHLVNVLLLFRLLRRTTGSPQLACLGALGWAVAPMHAEAMTWFVMSGHVLATTCILGVLASLVASAGRPPGIARGLAWILSLLVASTANGAGTAAALGLPFAAWLLLPPGAARRWSVAVLATAWLPIVTVMLASRAAGHLPGIVPGFTSGLPPPKHWPASLRLFSELLRHGVTGPLVGLALPHPSPRVAWLVALAWLAAGAGALRMAASSARRTTAGLLVVALAVYGVTALARGGLYALLARVAGEGGALARYHYLGTALLVAVTCQIVALLLCRWPLPRPVLRAAPFAATAVLLLAWSLTSWRLDHREIARDHLARMHRQIEAAAIAAAPPGGIALLTNQPTPGLGGLMGQAAFPGWAAVLALTEPDGEIAGRHVLLVEPDVTARLLAATGRRTAGIVVVP
ncbi:MAG: hypothetical protein KIT14_17605 [bacterium]|nr:hypothetical protein [bacterium]